MDIRFICYIYRTGRAFFKRVTENVKGNIQNFPYAIQRNENKTFIGYRRELSKSDKKLCGVWLAYGYVLAVTLTTKDVFTESELNKKFNKLVEVLRNGVDSSAAYIKALDAFKKGKHFHLHVLFQFPNGIPRVKGKELGKWWFVKHWKWSAPSALDVQKPYKPYGWLDYMLNPRKDNVIDIENGDKDKLFVKFKKYTRIVTYSKNLIFEEPIEVIECEKTEVFDLVNHYVEEFGGIDGSDVFKRAVYSKWIDEHEKEHKNLMYCHIHP